MAFLTALILAAFIGYAFALYQGLIEGNFSLVLFVAVVVTGLYWLAERFYFAPKRLAVAKAIEAQSIQRKAQLAGQGILQDDIDVSQAAKVALAQPWWLDWTAGLFPVILVVFLLRSFLYEPFKIPSGSMIPTLLVGDLILVNKYTYGVRLPVIHTRITQGNTPQRGDVMVFRYPPNPNVDYIKRVVGVPGDEVSYLNKELKINGQLVVKTPQSDYFESQVGRYNKQFEQRLGEKTFNLLNDPQSLQPPQPMSDFSGPQDQCKYNDTGVVCKVPAGHYFMMGDNRDNSLDSRFWGFVPEENIVGKATLVWMNFGHFNRIGTQID